MNEWPLETKSAHCYSDDLLDCLWLVARQPVMYTVRHLWGYFGNLRKLCCLAPGRSEHVPRLVSVWHGPKSSCLCDAAPGRHPAPGSLGLMRTSSGCTHTCLAQSGRGQWSQWRWSQSQCTWCLRHSWKRKEEKKPIKHSGSIHLSKYPQAKGDQLYIVIFYVFLSGFFLSPNVYLPFPWQSSSGPQSLTAVAVPFTLQDTVVHVVGSLTVVFESYTRPRK